MRPQAVCLPAEGVGAAAAGAALVAATAAGLTCLGAPRDLAGSAAVLHLLERQIAEQAARHGRHRRYMREDPVDAAAFLLGLVGEAVHAEAHRGRVALVIRLHEIERDDREVAVAGARSAVAEVARREQTLLERLRRKHRVACGDGKETGRSGGTAAAPRHSS